MFITGNQKWGTKGEKCKGRGGQRKGSDRGRRKTEEEEDSRKGRKLSGRGSNKWAGV